MTGSLELNSNDDDLGDGQRKRRRQSANDGSGHGVVKERTSTSHDASDSDDKQDGVSATLMQFKAGKNVKGKQVKARVVIISVHKSRSVFEEWLKDDSQVKLVKRLRQSPSNKLEDAKFEECKRQFRERKAALSLLQSTQSELFFFGVNANLAI